MFGLSKTVSRILAAALVVILVLGFLQVRSCQMASHRAAQSRVDKGQAGASVSSGVEATNTLTNVVKGDAQTDATVKGGIDEIRSAAEGQRGAAAQRAACRLRAYQHDSRCAGLRGANPANAH